MLQRSYWRLWKCVWLVWDCTTLVVIAWFCNLSCWSSHLPLMHNTLLRLARPSSRQQQVKSKAFDIVETHIKIKHHEAPILCGSQWYTWHTHDISFPVQHAMNETSVVLYLVGKWPRLNAFVPLMFCIWPRQWPHLCSARGLERLAASTSRRAATCRHGKFKDRQENWDEKGTGVEPQDGLSLKSSIESYYILW